MPQPAEILAAVRQSPSYAATRAILTHDGTRVCLLVEGLLALAMLIIIAWNGDDAAHLFTAANFALGAITLGGGIAITHAILAPDVYLPLAERTSRAAIIRGLALVCGGIAAALALVIIALALLFQRVQSAAPGQIAAGTLGLLANCVVLSTLAVTLSSPITTHVERLLFLVWLDVALYSISGGDGLSALLWLAHVPMLPLVACIGFGVTGVVGWPGLAALLIMVGYAVALPWLADRLLSRHRFERPEAVTPDSAA